MLRISSALSGEIVLKRSDGDGEQVRDKGARPLARGDEAIVLKAPERLSHDWPAHTICLRQHPFGRQLASRLQLPVSDLAPELFRHPLSEEWLALNWRGDL